MNHRRKRKLWLIVIGIGAVSVAVLLAVGLYWTMVIQPRNLKAAEYRELLRGRWMQTNFFKSRVLEFTGDDVVIMHNAHTGKEMVRYQFPDRSDYTADADGLAVRHNNELGIYELDGDRLTVMLDVSGNEYPVDFDLPGRNSFRSTLSLYTLERER